MGPPQHMETDKGRRGTAWNQGVRTQEKETSTARHRHVHLDHCASGPLLKHVPAFIFMSSCACDL